MSPASDDPYAQRAQTVVDDGGALGAPPELGPDDVVLTLLLQEARASDLHELADQISDPQSPQYGQYLDREALAKWVVPDEEAEQVVTAWLMDFGVRPLPGLPNAQVLFFAAPKARIGEIFGKQAERWLFDHNSDRAQRMEWKIPRRVAGYIESVQIVHDNHSQNVCLREGQWLSSESVPDTVHDLPEPEGVRGLTPADVARIYEFPTAFSGKGETIALLMLGSAPDPKDLEKFWDAHGIKRGGWTQIVRLGPQMPGQSSLGQLEAAMTAEWAGAMAPDANLVIYVVDERAVANPWTT
ncbi:MAG: hypothetical protein KC613_12200, partial [Myxococcales bacterium]|nr:hypothetical protein [Myxococcales bacterium]